jgi:hypothetical protein
MGTPLKMNTEFRRQEAEGVVPFCLLNPVF